MTDPTSIVALVAGLLHISPYSVLLMLFVVHLAAKAIARLIPDSATGLRAVVRRIATVVSVDISNRIAPGISVVSVARAAAAQPAIAQKVADAAETKEGQ